MRSEYFYSVTPYHPPSKRRESLTYSESHIRPQRCFFDRILVVFVRVGFDEPAEVLTGAASVNYVSDFDRHEAADV